MILSIEDTKKLVCARLGPRVITILVQVLLVEERAWGHIYIRKQNYKLYRMVLSKYTKINVGSRYDHIFTSWIYKNDGIL